MHYILSALLYKRQFVSLRWRINFLWQCVPWELSKFIWRHWKNSVSYFPILEEIYQYVLLLCWFSSAKSTKWVRALCIHFPNISRLYRDVDTYVSDTFVSSTKAYLTLSIMDSIGGWVQIVARTHHLFSLLLQNLWNE